MKNCKSDPSFRSLKGYLPGCQWRFFWNFFAIPTHSFLINYSLCGFCVITLLQPCIQKHVTDKKLNHAACSFKGYSQDGRYIYYIMQWSLYRQKNFFFISPHPKRKMDAIWLKNDTQNYRPINWFLPPLWSLTLQLQWGDWVKNKIFS